MRAYQLYLDSGCQHGNDWYHWFQAEKEIGAKFFTPPAGKSADIISQSKPSETKAAQPKAAEAKPAETKASNGKAPANKVPAKKMAAKAPAKKAAGKK
jgi:hypothetical protein